MNRSRFGVSVTVLWHICWWLTGTVSWELGLGVVFGGCVHETVNTGSRGPWGSKVHRSIVSSPTGACGLSFYVLLISPRMLTCHLCGVSRRLNVRLHDNPESSIWCIWEGNLDCALENEFILFRLLGSFSEQCVCFHICLFDYIYLLCTYQDCELFDFSSVSKTLYIVEKAVISPTTAYYYAAWHDRSDHLSPLLLNTGCRDFPTIGRTIYSRLCSGNITAVYRFNKIPLLPWVQGKQRPTCLGLALVCPTESVIYTICIICGCPFGTTHQSQLIQC